MKHRALLISLVVLMVSAFAACPGVVGYTERGSFDRSLKVTGPVELDVQTGAGSINVRTGSADVVEVHATIKAGGMHALEKVKRLESNPPIEQTGNTIRIGQIKDDDLRRNVSISYDLVVPAQTQLRSHSGSGHQTIEGVKGPVTADTGSGGVTINNVGGQTTAHTGSGGIELDSIQGPVRAETGSGSIRATKIAGAFEGHTGSGHITLSQAAQGDVRVETGSGSVDLDNVRGGLRAEAGSGNIKAAGEATGSWYVHTGSGSIELRLPPQAGFDLFAHTGSGRISTERQITMQGNLDRHELRGKVGNGGPTLELRTGSGNITIQ